MASESCSTSSSSFGDNFVPIFLLRKVMKSLRRSYDKKRSTVDQTDAAAAEAQSGENENDPDLDLWQPASRVVNTFWCQCRKCVAKDRRQDCFCCFDSVQRMEKLYSASNNGTYCKVTNFRTVFDFVHFVLLKKYEFYYRMKISFCFEAIEFQRHFLRRPSKVRKLVRTNQFQVES